MIRHADISSPASSHDSSVVSLLSPSSWPSRLLNAGRSRLWYCRELRIYRYPLEEAPPLPRPTIFRRNCLDDLRYYERSAKEQQTPDVYRRMAVERRAQGFHLYTFVAGGRLLHYAWLIERQTRGEDGWVNQAYFPPPETAVLFDHFTHPLARGRGLYYQALCRLLHDARDVTGARQAYVTVFGSNSPSRHVIEKVGFQHEASLFKERRLIWSKRYAVSAGGAFQHPCYNRPSFARSHVECALLRRWCPRLRGTVKAPDADSEPTGNRFTDSMS